jgi:hypothetical protein
MTPAPMTATRIACSNVYQNEGYGIPRLIWNQFSALAFFAEQFFARSFLK